jgi:hypothetical protein
VELRVALLKHDVPQPLFCATSPSNFEHLRRSVHTNNISFHRDVGGLTSSLSRTATDIEHSVTYSDAGGGPEMPVVPP